MRNSTVKVAIFCVVSTVVFSSCVKKTFNTATQPIVKTSKTIWNCVSALFGCSSNKKAIKTQQPHAHRPPTAAKADNKKMVKGR